eukprot:Em0014g614a
MNLSSRNRIRCPTCNQKLSYSAYKRHKNTLYCPPRTSSEETSQVTLHVVGGPDYGSDECQTEEQYINDAWNYDQPEINGDADDEEVIQKFPINGMVLSVLARNPTLRIRNKIMKHKLWTILMTSIKNCLYNLQSTRRKQM